MELRAYLDILRRRWKLLAAATVIVAVVAGVTSSLKTPMYSASAEVLLRPNDPAEQLSQSNQQSRSAADADRYLQGQLDVVESQAVAKVVSDQLGGADVKSLLEMVDASQVGTTDIVEITATDPDPARAAQVANAFAGAYIENRRLSDVGGLEKAISEIDAKLVELEGRISTLDAEIDEDLTTQERQFRRQEAKKKPRTITVPVTQPDGTVIQQPITQPPVESQFTGTANESLATARYAAAVQYQSLYAQQQNLLVTKSLKKGEAEQIATARVPESPSSPKPKRDSALGAIVGLMLGLGFAFLREQLDERLRTREEAEEASGLTVLAELPLDEESEKHPDQLTAHVHPSGLMAESVRSLRTSLTFLGVDEPSGGSS
ncbi:MAG: YveK family protein [Acidimicrobiia bacterium]